MANNLADESSPYLLQHKDNPVNWYSWNDESLQKAKSENKPNVCLRPIETATIPQADRSVIKANLF